MTISGWGNYPVIDADISTPATSAVAAHSVNEGFNGIARGLGRSYGDSSLAPQAMSMLAMDHMLEFDDASGVLVCEAGVSLAGILAVFVPRGWFLPVTPGTRFVTVGGAIGSDVHGKNHHHDGCFSQHLEWFDLVLADGNTRRVSAGAEPELFAATCGGMGLTGIITRAAIRLAPINSAYIDETTIKARNLDKLLELYDAHEAVKYSVAWIDCLSTGKQFGRSLLSLGDHATDGDLSIPAQRQLSMPVSLPNFALNPFTIRAFNTLYYHRVMQHTSSRRAYYAPFFYPLDNILHWNRLYGSSGFTQHQFVIPKAAGAAAMADLLRFIAKSGRGSFLAVLKTLGPENANWLSFPMEGYTLALDFKISKGLFEFLDELDRRVTDYGGRIYLTKDVRMSTEILRAGYPHAQKLVELRKRMGLDKTFNSLQSQRLEL